MWLPLLTWYEHRQQDKVIKKLQHRVKNLQYIGVAKFYAKTSRVQLILLQCCRLTEYHPPLKPAQTTKVQKIVQDCLNFLANGVLTYFDKSNHPIPNVTIMAWKRILQLDGRELEQIDPQNPDPRIIRRAAIVWRMNELHRLPFADKARFETAFRILEICSGETVTKYHIFVGKAISRNDMDEAFTLEMKRFATFALIALAQYMSWVLREDGKFALMQLWGNEVPGTGRTIR